MHSLHFGQPHPSACALVFAEAGRTEATGKQDKGSILSGDLGIKTGCRSKFVKVRYRCRPLDGCSWRFADVNLLGNSTGVVFETVERHLSVLADLDEVAVGITHIATPFPTVIV